MKLSGSTLFSHVLRFASPRIVCGVFSTWSSAKSKPKFSYSFELGLVTPAGANAAADETRETVRSVDSGAILL